MKSFCYKNSYFERMADQRLTMVEHVLFATLLVTVLVGAYDATQGYDIGNLEEIKLAKLQGKQSLVAQQMPEGK